MDNINMCAYSPCASIDSIPCLCNGVVMAMDWVRMPDGRAYLGFQGDIGVASAKETLGWEPTGHNSANWFCRIVGKSTSVFLMGCQVRLVLENANPESTTDIYVVP